MSKKINYKSSGVDIKGAEKFIRSIKGDVARTLGSSVLKRTGAFGSLFALDIEKYKNPVFEIFYPAYFEEFICFFDIIALMIISIYKNMIHIN